jgi:YggT family protein
MAIDLVLSVIEYAILARVLISFLPISRDNQLIRLLYQITEPILAPLRNLLEKSPIGGNSMFDFSPLIAFLIIGLIRNLF